jgi:hypothetical protein
VKHPVLVGAAAGVVGLVIWWKRSAIAAAYQRLRGRSMQGFGSTSPVPGLPATADPSVCVRQIKRYTFAAMQDQSPIVGLTHASYALILMDTLEEMVGRQAIQAAGYDPVAVRQLITELQDQHVKRLEACDPFLGRVLALEKKGGGALPGFVMNDAVGAPTGA